MPPKKAEEASAPEADASDENAPDPRLLEQKAMVERELAASHLATRLARYQTDAAALVDERTALMDALETTRAEAGDANAKLSEQLRGVHATVASLRARLAELEEAREAGASRGEARLSALAAESAEKRRAMVSDLAARDALVAQLDAFEETRAALETELREKEGLLTSARAARETATRAVETETRLAKQAMKEDLANKIRETKREMKRTTDLQLAGTTKRTIAENEQMLGELRYQARESAAIETRRAAFAADARAADATTRLCLREEKDIAMYNRTLANELKRLERRLRAEHAAARVEREVEDAEAAEAKKQTKKQTKSGAALVSARKKEKGPVERLVALRGGGNARREKIRNPRYEGKPRRVSARLRFRPGRARRRRGLRGVAAATARRRRRTRGVARGARRGEWRENARGDVPTGRLVRIARRYRT